MNVFIAVKFKDASDSEVLPVLKEVIKAAGHAPYAFVDEGYIKDEKEMMSKAAEKLDQSDLMVVEASRESLGVGIETGYFFSQRKPIITVFRKDAKVAGTLKGISSECIEYGDFTELREKLLAALSAFKP
jgi:nucleoside 2-deoxyribosyltransferase